MAQSPIGETNEIMFNLSFCEEKYFDADTYNWRSSSHCTKLMWHNCYLKWRLNSELDSEFLLFFYFDCFGVVIILIHINFTFHCTKNIFNCTNYFQIQTSICCFQKSEFIIQFIVIGLSVLYLHHNNVLCQCLIFAIKSKCNVSKNFREKKCDFIYVMMKLMHVFLFFKLFCWIVVKQKLFQTIRNGNPFRIAEHSNESMQLQLYLITGTYKISRVLCFEVVFFLLQFKIGKKFMREVSFLQFSHEE